MRREMFGEMRVTIAGGSDRQGGGDGPVVVLLHGYGAPGDDLVSFARVLRVPDGTRFVFPEAPIALGGPYGAGRAWWELDLAALQRAITTGQTWEMTRVAPPGLLEARDVFVRMLDALMPALSARFDSLVLGGFSQGAMVALEIALHIEQPPAACALFSSTLIGEPDLRVRLQGRAGLPVFQSHGTNDSLLPFALAEQLHHLMVDAGLRVEWVPFRGGHEVPHAVLEKFEGFLGRALGPAV